ncbi:hypothetical protein R1sor_019886 [Riccia sorocarpa]|uniref:Uncharacterized protein n=1 Tax=Riccia sorocarpa TaxID=122646 RepID=A0ABD3IH28_9MARC
MRDQERAGTEAGCPLLSSSRRVVIVVFVIVGHRRRTTRCIVVFVVGFETKRSNPALSILLGNNVERSFSSEWMVEHAGSEACGSGSRMPFVVVVSSWCHRHLCRRRSSSSDSTMHRHLRRGVRNKGSVSAFWHSIASWQCGVVVVGERRPGYVHYDL